MISILLKTAFWQTSIHSQSLVKILMRSAKHKLLLSRLKNIAMVSEKLYRNILRPSTKNGWPSFCLQAIRSQLKCQNKWKATLGSTVENRLRQTKGKIIKTVWNCCVQKEGSEREGWREGGGGGGEGGLFSRQLQAFINEKKIHWTSCYCLNCLNPLTVQMVSDHNTWGLYRNLIF